MSTSSSERDSHMPRRRSVVCSSCGTFLRARDTQCEVCGAWTARLKQAVFFKGLSVVAALLGALYVWHALQQFGATVAPH